MNGPVTTTVVQLPPEIVQPAAPMHNWHNWRLMVAVFIMTMFNFDYGGFAGYPSPALPNLNHHRNPFHVTADEQSWVGSLFALGGAVAGLIMGTANDILGRKVTMIMSSIFVIAGFTIIAAATNVSYLYAGIVIISFFSLMNASASMLYTAEVSPDDIRGTCISFTTLAYSVGMMVTFAVGIVLPWNWLAIFLAAIYAAPNLVLVFLPESPRWFLLNGNREAAIHGLKWFRGGADRDVSDEIRAIEDSLLTLPSKTGKKFDLTIWKELVVTAENRMSLFVCVFLMVLQGFSGNMALQMFTVTIFELAGATSLNPNVQAVIAGACAVVGSVLCSVLVDRVGRKPLFIASTIVTSIGMAILGAFFKVLETTPEYARAHFPWLPILGFALGNLGYTAGLLPVPYMLSCEMFPTNVRGNAQATTLLFQGLSNFACAKTFLDIQKGIHTSGAFFIYTGVTATAAVFAAIFLKEPKPENMR